MTDEPYPADVRAAARSRKLKPLDYTHQNPSYPTVTDHGDPGRQGPSGS